MPAETHRRAYLHTRLGEAGRIVIPAELRAALGMKVGDPLTMHVEDGELRIFTLDEAIRRAQETVRRYIPEERCLSEEPIAERRAEAARE